MSPLISVVIPSFNSAFIGETVDSVLLQTFENFELIIVDCSTDISSVCALNDFKHANIKVYRRPERHLPGSNRNFGIERASGEFIICLDADDLIDPTFLEEALFVICCIGYSLVGTSMRTIGVMEQTMKLYPHPTLEQVVHGDAFVVTILLRKELWHKLGGFNDTALGKDHIPEDWDFFVRALADGATLYNRGSYGFQYRKHYASITAQPDMPSFDEMRKRIRERHTVKLSSAESSLLPPSPVIDKGGWKRLLTGRQPSKAGLLLLPESINNGFFESLKHSIATYEAPLVVLSTWHIETYAAEFRNFLGQRNCQIFSLPDFLEDRVLWPEFVSYLSESRSIDHIWYGQNSFFIDHLAAISAAFPHAAVNYIPRYMVPQAVLHAIESRDETDSLML